MSKLAQLFVWSGTRPRPSVPRVTPAAFGCRYEDVQFPSAFDDRVPLSGWLVSPAEKSAGIIILCHGHVSTRSEMLKPAVLLSKHHFTTLLFDFRARGLSQGSHCTMGQLEMWDVIGAVEFIKSRADIARLPLCVLGNSMGGAAAILAAARDERIRAVVTEGTFASLRSVVKQRVRLASGPISARLTDQCAALGRTEVNLDIDAVNPAEVIGTISPRHVLLITDGLDVTCPRSESDQLFASANEPKERWIASAAPHGCAYRVYTKLYEEKVVGFLSRALG